ncbi:MAG: histidinol phosphate aminotransferase [Rhodobacteraceae bacterium]|nr:histidinol phosphate aminotransferase [Paracoccaceae bacterium]
MRDDHERPAAPDYTAAAITMLGVNLMWIFFVLWVLIGFIPVLLLAACINHGISRFELRYQ